MSVSKTEKNDALFDDLLDVELEITTAVHNLMNAEWDSPTLKGDIEELNKERNRIYNEIELLEKKN